MGLRVRWKCDSERSVLVNNFEARSWGKANNDEDWNFYWANVGSVKMLFNPEVGHRLNDSQILNHFPNHYELTRKDLMVKNIKRYKRELEREYGVGRDKKMPDLDFVPVTYVLPTDYALFVEEYKKNPNTMWIMKPTSKARGIGIFIIYKLSQIKRWANSRFSLVPARDQYVISRYIDNPLLIGERKFDLRLYVLVTSYRPLKAYLYRKGFARFCAVRYTNEVAELDNQLVHLTNVAIQKHADEYDDRNGCKWSLENLRLYLDAVKGREATQKLFDDIQNSMVQSLKACQNVLINDRHCFECYGYDVIIDANLKPWLIEVNASPSLSATTPSDRTLKLELMRDTMSCVIPSDLEDLSQITRLGATYTPSTRDLGNYEVLIDEVAENEQIKEADGSRRRPSSRYSWR